MRGVWESAGRELFAVSRSDALEMDVYTWRLDCAAGKFEARFGCVCDERPRRLFCLDALEAWREKRQPELLLKQGCRVGSRLLMHFEAALQAGASALPPETRDAAYKDKLLVLLRQILRGWFKCEQQ
jgi:hypothetical protein